VRLLLGNTATKLITGGKDNLLDVSLGKELKEYLRVRPNGYYHNTQYVGNGGRWDGWRKFITASNTFATGFAPMVVSFAKDLGATIEIEDNRNNTLEFNSIVRTIPTFSGGVWEAREEQYNSLRTIKDNTLEGVPFHRGIFNHATNGGKSYTMAFLHASIKNSKTLLIVHRTGLFKQHVKFFSEVFTVTQINSDSAEFGSFTIAMSKTLYNRGKNSSNVKAELKKYNNVMVDEAHWAGGAEYSTLLQWMDAPCVAFFSGTALKSKSKVSKLVIVGLSGLVIDDISKRELIDKGVSQEPIVKILLNNPTLKASFDYKTEMLSNVYLSNIRAQQMIELAQYHKDDQILIPVAERKQGYFLLEKFNEVFEAGEAEFIYSGDGSAEDKIENFKSKMCRILITTSVLQEGINIKVIRVLMMAFGGMNEIALSQFSGRAERMDDEQNLFFYLYDWYDVGKWTAFHSRKRIKFYKDEQFKISFDYDCDKRGIPK